MKLLRMIADSLLFKEESFRIIGAAMEVHNVLGCGFTEPIYQEAFEKELELRNIPFEREKEFHVNYKGVLLEKKFRTDFGQTSLAYERIPCTHKWNNNDK